jgi:multidrug transporter EmrE-like cation transporter
MRPINLAFIATSAVLTVSANLLLRQGLIKSGGLALRQGAWLSGWLATLMQPAFLAGIVCYGLAAMVWFYALSITEVSSGYPVLVGLTFFMVTLGGLWLFDESLNPLKIAGIVTVLVGVAMVARGS